MTTRRLAAICSVCGEIWRVNDSPDRRSWLTWFARKHQENANGSPIEPGGSPHVVRIESVTEGDETALRDEFGKEG